MTRPESLKQAIEQAANTLLDSKGTAQDCMVYIGNRHGSHPTSLIIDPSLTAVDVRLYQFLLQHMAGGFGMEASPAPPYALISKRLHITKPTIANSITRLRLTRWIVRLEQVRDARGRFRGQIFAFADEPLALIDTVRMDPDYMTLLENTARHHGDRRTCRVAKAVLAVIEEQKARGEDPMARPEPLETRRQSILGLDSEQPARFFNVDTGVLYAKDEKTLPGELNHPGQISLPGQKQPSQDFLPGDLPSQNSLPGHFKPGQKTLPGSQPGKEILPGQQAIDSEGNEKTLLGALYSTVGNVSNVHTGDSVSENPIAAESSEPEMPDMRNLRWHKDLSCISSAHQSEILKSLQTLPEQDAQAILDALAYRYQSIRIRGAEPLRKGPLAYTRTLLKQLRAGTLKPVSPEESPVSQEPKPRPIQSPDSKPPHRAIELSREIAVLSKLMRQLPETPSGLQSRMNLQQQISQLEGQLEEMRRVG